MIPSSIAPLLLPESSLCRAEAAAFWRALSRREARYSGVTASSISLSSRSSSSSSDSESESESVSESEPVESELEELEEEEACGAVCECETSSMAMSSGSAFPFPLSGVEKDICGNFGARCRACRGPLREMSKQVALLWSAFAVFELHVRCASRRPGCYSRSTKSAGIWRCKEQCNRVAMVNVRGISSDSPAGAKIGASIKLLFA